MRVEKASHERALAALECMSLDMTEGVGATTRLVKTMADFDSALICAALDEIEEQETGAAGKGDDHG